MKQKGGIQSERLPTVEPNLYNKKLVENPTNASKKNLPIKGDSSYNPDLDTYLSKHVIKLLKKEFKIDFNLKLRKKLYKIVKKEPKLSISIVDLLFMDLEKLSDKFINLILILINHKGGANRRLLTFERDHPEGLRHQEGYTGFTNIYQTDLPTEDDLPGSYLREGNRSFPRKRIPYKYLNISEIKSCNNVFEQCDLDDPHQEYCILSNQIQNPENRIECPDNVKCSPKDIISIERFSNQENTNIYQYDITKECYGANMLNSYFNYKAENPTTREIFYLEQKIRIYLDTLIKQQIEKNSSNLKTRMSRLSDIIDRKINENPIKFGVGGVLAISAIFSFLPSRLSEQSVSTILLGTCGLAIENILIRNYILAFRRESFKSELYHIIPYKIYNKIFEKMFESLRNQEMFNFVNNLPHFPIGDVFETLKVLLD